MGKKTVPSGMACTSPVNRMVWRAASVDGVKVPVRSTIEIVFGEMKRIQVGEDLLQACCHEEISVRGQFADKKFEDGVVSSCSGRGRFAPS